MPCCCSRPYSFYALAVAGVLAIAGGLASQQDKPASGQQSQKPGAHAAAAAKTDSWKGDPYTLDTCPVSGEKLGGMGKPVVKQYDGREVRFCCEDCVAKFEADKTAYFKKIDEQLTKQQMAHYPLTHCVVMEDDALSGGHEEPVNLVYKNRLVRFCCAECPKEFEKNPDEYIRKLDAAVIEQQKDKYPLTICPVSGEKLGGMGEPVNMVIGTTLVRLCCDGCVKAVQKDPLPVLAKVHEGWKGAHGAADHGDAEKPADKPHGHE